MPPAAQYVTRPAETTFIWYNNPRSKQENGRLAMDRQTTFADIEDASRRRATRREAFLEAMDEAIPWDELVAAVEPFYYCF